MSIIIDGPQMPKRRNLVLVISPDGLVLIPTDHGYQRIYGATARQITREEAEAARKEADNE